MKRWILITIAVASLFFPAFAYADGVLDVKATTQKFDQWCWAGASWTILDYYGVNLSQCDIANYTRKNATFHDFGNVDCCEDSSTPGWKCNYWNYNWGSPGSILHILKNWKVDNYGKSAALTKPTVVKEISAGHPFVIRWGYHSGGGHFLVGHGIKKNNLYYMDPWQGEGLKIASYDWVKSNNQKNWTHTNVVTTNPTPNGDVKADFSYMADQSSVDFTDQSHSNNSTINQWAWNFGDKKTSTESNPSHAYESPGTYDVKLTVWEKGGNSDAIIKKVTINSAPKQISFDGFESKTFKKGEGWLRKSWKKRGDVRIIEKKPFEGKYYVRMRKNTGYLKRTVDLKNVTSARLKFAARARLFESGDKAYVKVSHDNVTYTIVKEFTLSDSDNQYHTFEIDLREFLPANPLRVVFESKMSGLKDYWYLDNIEITGE